jgi:hypothetical protein
MTSMEEIISIDEVNDKLQKASNDYLKSEPQINCGAENFSNIRINSEPNSAEENEERKCKLRGLLKDHLTNEMFLAMQEIIYSPHIAVRLFSVGFLLVSYVLASYTTLNLILSYFEYGVTNSVRTVYERPAVFPKVSVCNVNQFTSKYGYEFLRNLTNNTFDTSFPENLSSFERLKQAYITQVKAFTLANNSKYFEKKSLGQDLNDSLLSCAFNLYECTSDDFSWYYDAIYGNCYSFNSGFNSTGQRRDDSVSYLAGSWHGLQVDFFVRSYENISLFNSIWGGSGAIIRIDNVSHVIDHIRDGIFVSPGSSTYVALNREFKTILPKPYSNCEIESYDKLTYFDSELYRLIKNSYYDYTQNFCLEQCLLKLLVEKCGCQLSFFRSVINSKICFSDSEINCSILSYWNIYLKGNYIQNVCMPQCPLECYSNKFSYTTSSYDVHGDLYVNKIKNNPNLASNFVAEEINAETVRKSFVRINVFYESLSYIISEEAPQLDGFSLVANIGGNLGLFISVSFFSICEIITTLIELYL